MDLVITLGMTAVFFAIIIGVLYFARLRDHNFSEYAVGGRSFNGFFVAMSFLNTWWPGTTFIAFAGLSAASGLIGFYALLYSLLSVILMYLMAKKVWVWGARHDVRTQPDLLSLRFNSQLIKPVATIINVVSTFPWIVLGMQALGDVFRYLTLDHLSVLAAMLLGVGLIGIRQIWTIQMGMRGVVITDMIQGVLAYIVGGVVILGVIILFFHGLRAINSLPHVMFTLPSPGTTLGPLYFFSLVATGALGGWSWGSIFVRLFTGDGVKSIKQSAFIALPISFVFFTLLTLFAMSGASLPEVAKAPQEVWFIVTQQAGGIWLLALGGVIVFAATMGNIDGNIQALGAMVANDIAGAYWKTTDALLGAIAKISMAILVIVSVVVAVLTFSLPNLVTLAQMSYQGIIQLAVPQFIGIFWKGGNRYGANAGLIVGFLCAIVLTGFFPDLVIPGLGGITSGVVALVLNVVIYVVVGALFPTPSTESSRVAQLFDSVRAGAPAPQTASAVGGK